MASESVELLSAHLLREVRDTAFFRVLSGSNAATYIDVLDALDRESTERPDGLAREEAIDIIGEVLARHPDFQPDDDDEPPSSLTTNPKQAPQHLPTRERARQVLDHLSRCRWIEEPPRRDWQRRVFFDAHGATMMAALRRIAHPDAAVFTDKLLAVCAMLANEIELSHRPWQTVEACLSNAKQGLTELRSMQKSVQRLTRRQLEEDTLKGNLALVFDDYSEQLSHACYAELVRARLPVRLPEAVHLIGERLLSDHGAMAEMQTELLRRNPDMSAAAASATVRAALDELAHLLDMVLPMADEIDRRTADFTRRSLARFRYLQDVTSERRAELREFFEQTNRLLKGRRLSALNLPELPPFRLPDARIPNGRDSLYSPPNRLPSLQQDPLDSDISDGDRDEGLRDMERALRDSLSVQRANRLIHALPGGKGTRISSADLQLPSEDVLTDIIALLLHAESTEARYRLEADRVADDDLDISLDALPGCRVERFHIIKK